MTKRGVLCWILGLALGQGYAAEPAWPDGAEAFAREIIHALITSDGTPPPFEIAEKVFAMDNGETLSRTELQEAWPRMARRAVAKKITAEQFFSAVDLRIDSPKNHERLMRDEKVQAVYTYQDGDLYVDASRMKAGTENIIAYDKAFLYLIRKINGKWTLIGLGG